MPVERIAAARLKEHDDLSFDVVVDRAVTVECAAVVGVSGE